MNEIEKYIKKNIKSLANELLAAKNYDYSKAKVYNHVIQMIQDKNIRNDIASNIAKDMIFKQCLTIVSR